MFSLRTAHLAVLEDSLRDKKNASGDQYVRYSGTVIEANSAGVAAVLKQVLATYIKTERKTLDNADELPPYRYVIQHFLSCFVVTNQNTNVGLTQGILRLSVTGRS